MPDQNLFAAFPLGWESALAILYGLAGSAPAEPLFNPRLFGAWTMAGAALAVLGLMVGLLSGCYGQLDYDDSAGTGTITLGAGDGSANATVFPQAGGVYSKFPSVTVAAGAGDRDIYCQSPMNTQIRKLIPDEAEAYYELKREMLAAAPRAFLASPESDVLEVRILRKL